MKKVSLVLAAAMIAAPALAQDSASPLPVFESSEAPEVSADTTIAEEALLEAAATEAAGEAPLVQEARVMREPPSCELHIFPTLEGQAQTTSALSAFGLLGGLADAAVNEGRNMSDAEYLRDALGPQFQVEAFQSIDVPAALGLPEGTEVTYETPIDDRDITTKVRTRLTESTAACYVELIVTQNLYTNRAIYGRALNNRFIYKDFRNGVNEARMVRGRGGNGLTHFPPETPEGREAADADLRQTFLANFDEYAARFK